MRKAVVCFGVKESQEYGLTCAAPLEQHNFCLRRTGRDYV